VRPRTGSLRWITAVVIAIALVAGGWWAGRSTMRSAAADRSAPVSTVVSTVTEATVGRSLALTVTVEQPFVGVAVNGLTGTVTSVDVRRRVDLGDTLYTVDTVPVRAVAGAMPFYRDLGPGVVGRDVAQLQRNLATLGLHRGGTHGRFDAATGQAVRSWQRRLRTAVTGTVRLGEVVAVPRLPAALRLGEAIVTGARLGGGEPAVFAATGEVAFLLVVSPAQAAQVPDGAAVIVTHQQERWSARITDSSTTPDGAVRFVLSAPGGGPVCATACGRLPGQERISLRAEVTLVPDLTGPAVPLAAVRTRADGSTYVVMADGSPRAVTVRATSGGVAVVDGVRVGERVIVLGPANEQR
jgi:peptidoglycan hydrolase-like protein with peptidoglycan-binding domain